MEQKKSGSTLPISGGLLLFTIIFGTLFVTQHPFHVKRTSGTHIHETSSDAVPARLWEDPFSALENSILGNKPFKYPQEGHQPADLASMIKKTVSKDGALDILGIWVWGGPRTEASEWRIRSRYAALSALGVLGFRPEDAEHLNYMLFSVKNDAGTRDIPIPYELFSAERLNRSVAILWFDSELLPGSSMKEIENLKRDIISRCKESRIATPRFTLIGPAHSNDYREMIKWAINPKNSGFISSIPIYSPFVTVDESARSIKSLSSEDIDAEEVLRRAGIELVRTIHTDADLARAMRKELERRGIDPAEDKIALVSEWDSVYASELMDTFEKAFTDRENPSNILRYCYMRGLDGITQDANSQKGSKNKGDSGAGPESEIEKPVGQGQYDYLRRMGKLLAGQDVKAVGVLGSDVYDKLLVLEAVHDLITDAVFFTTDLDARYFHPAYTHWSRNLVVASSFGLRLAPSLQSSIPPFRTVYQTSLFLAVRQAILDSGTPSAASIREKLGSPRLFEIGDEEAFDISIENSSNKASDIHPQVYRSAWLGKNSLVMGFFALSLMLLPVLYVVIQQWIEKKGREDNSQAHTTEGSNGAEISPKVKDENPARHCAAEMNQAESTIPWQFWAVAASVLLGFMLLKSLKTCPAVFKTQAWPGTATVYLFLSLVIILAPPLFLMVSTIMKPDRFPVGQAGTEETCTHGSAMGHPAPALPRRFYIGTGISILITICCLCSAIRLQQSGGEPFTILGGISLWPPIFLMMLAGILALFFLYLSSYTLHRSIASIPMIFCRGCSSPSQFSDQYGINRNWTDYIRLSTPPIRLKRTAVIWLGYFAIAYLLVNMDRPFVPFRGKASFIFHCAGITMAVLPMLFLVLYVADVTKMCSKLTMKMLQAAHEPSAWCRKLSIAKHYGFKHSTKVLELWFNIRLLATHTEAIAHMVYFPLVVIIIMLLARLTCFDRVDTPAGLAAVIAMTMAHAVIWPARMRRHAELLRQKARDEFHEALLKASHNGEDSDAAQLKDMLAYVTNLDKGAFRPFSRQPWVHVIMTIFGGGGGYALLRYLGI